MKLSWVSRLGPRGGNSLKPTEVTKPYKFIGFGAMDVTKPYKFIGFGAMDVTKPYKFIGFGAMERRDHPWPSPTWPWCTVRESQTTRTDRCGLRAVGRKSSCTARAATHGSLLLCVGPSNLHIHRSGRGPEGDVSVVSQRKSSSGMTVTSD